MQIPVLDADTFLYELQNYTRLSPTVCVTWNFTAGKNQYIATDTVVVKLNKEVQLEPLYSEVSQ